MGRRELSRVITARERLALVGAFLLLWLASTGALVYYGKGIARNGDRTARAEQKSEQINASLRRAQIANCHRGNERTISDNISQLDDYRFFSLTSRLLEASLAMPQPASGLTTRQQAEQRAITVDFISRLKGDANRKVWHHLIGNCAYAVDHPRIYRLPPAVPFAKTGHHHTPPPGALKLERGE